MNPVSIGSRALACASAFAAVPAAAQIGSDAASLPSAAALPVGDAAAASRTASENEQQVAGASASSQSPVGTDGGGAQSVEEIIVTAERRSSSLQHTAAAITVRSGLALQREGKFTLRQQLEDVPSAFADDSGTLATAGSDTAGGSVTIRGIGANAQPGAVSAVPTAAVYVDGIFEGVGSSYDIDRLEVLRGPQGTLYGRSATAGVLSFHSRDPQLDQPHGDGSVELGSYDLRHYTGGVNAPIGDKAALRISGDQYQRDGFYNGNGGKVNRTSGRVKLLIKPSNAATLLLGIATQDNGINSGGRQGTLEAGGGIGFNTILPVTTSRNRFWQYWADIKLELGGITINYIPALRTWKQDAVQTSVGPALLPLRLLVQTPKDRFLTQELRFSGEVSDRLHWLVGAFYYDNRLHNTNDIRWASSGGLLASSDTHRHTENIGFYADATYDLATDWRVTGGARWDYTRVQTDQVYTTNIFFICNTPLAPTLPGGAPAIPGCLPGPGGANAGLPEVNLSASVGGDAGRRVYRNFNFRARVEHDLSPANLVYGAITSGFIPGDVQFGTGRNALGQQVPEVRPYDAETLTSYEIGSKNRFLDDKLQLNGDLFYYRYGGFQVQVNPNPIDPSAQFLVTVPARVWGAEIEGVIQPGRDDRLSFSYSYIKSRLRDLPDAYTAAVSQDFITGVAPHTINLSYGHTFHLGENTLLVGAYARYTSGFDRNGISPAFLAQLAAAGVDRDDVVRQSGQVVVNLESTLALDGDRFAITGYVRNLFDNRYVNLINLQSVAPVLSGSGGRADPRTFGVLASIRF